MKNNYRLPVYIISCEGKVLFASPDANEAFNKSVELSVDCHEHDVEIWIGEHRVGHIATNGMIQNIYKEA